MRGPEHLPFSNRKGEGFENRLAEMAAEALGKKVSYTWWAQRRGFVRKTLKAQDCDVISGVPRLMTWWRPPGPITALRTFF